MKYKILIIDDEPSALNILQILIEKLIGKDALIKSTTNPFEGKQLIENFLPNLIFLDIQMPGMTGLELLEKTVQKRFEVIFTTAFSEFAIQALRLSAIDYLLKPIKINELQNAIDRFHQKMDSQDDWEKKFQNLKSNLNQTEKQRLTIRTQDGTIFKLIENIIRFEGDNNYTYIHFKDGSKLYLAKTLKEYELILEPVGFVRIHKSHLVNQEFVKSLKKGQLELLNGEFLPVSRRRQAVLRRFMK